MARRDRFEGRICGVGSTSGHRVVIGLWERSPFGAFADVMHESAGGVRTLYAPTRAVADYVSATYTFDIVRVVPVAVETFVTRWDVHAGSVQLAVEIGPRLPLGRLLGMVPAGLATTPSWARIIDPVARLLQPGVRTAGIARPGRREYYCARDLHAVTGVVGDVDGVSIGRLAPVDPPTRFGFSSTPRRPAVATVVTIVEDLLR